LSLGGHDVVAMKDETPAGGASEAGLYDKAEAVLLLPGSGHRKDLKVSILRMSKG